MKRVIVWTLVVLIVLGFVAVSMRSIIGVVFLVLGLGGPLIVIPALLAPWVAVCRGARRLFGRLGIAPLWSRALAMVLFIAGLGLALTDLRARASWSPFEQIDGAKQIALSEVRVVQGVAGCPNRCVAGTVLNRGERTIAEVYLVFDYLDARGRALGGDGLVASLSPPGPLAPSARATFLYSPSASLMGIDPRFTAVKSRVSTVRFPDSSHLRRIGRWVSQAALRLDSGLVRGRSEWCTPDETQEYAKNVAVAGRLLDAGAGRYRVEGVIDNRGGLPLRAAQVRVWAEDAEGVVLGGLVDEVVRYYYDSQEGAYAPLPAHGTRPFSGDLMLSPNPLSKTNVPVSLEISLQSISLGPKPATP